MQRDWFMYHLRSTYKNHLEYPKGGGTYFHWGGGGGGKDKKGHCNVKKGTNGVHADNYALMR